MLCLIGRNTTSFLIILFSRLHLRVFSKIWVRYLNLLVVIWYFGDALFLNPFVSGSKTFSRASVPLVKSLASLLSKVLYGSV